LRSSAGILGTLELSGTNVSNNRSFPLHTEFDVTHPVSGLGLIKLDSATRTRVALHLSGLAQAWEWTAFATDQLLGARPTDRAHLVPRASAIGGQSSRHGQQSERRPGLAWGIFPILFSSAGTDQRIGQIGILAARVGALSAE